MRKFSSLRFNEIMKSFRKDYLEVFTPVTVSNQNTGFCLQSGEHPGLLSNGLKTFVHT